MSTPIVERDRRSTRRRLSEAEKRAIVAAYTAKGSIQLVAHDFDLNRNTVAKIVNSVRKLDGSVLNASWRSDMQKNAIQSVNRALVDDADVYKSANVAVQALKGLGVFTPDQQINVAALVQNMPADVLGLMDSTATPSAEVPDNGADEPKLLMGKCE